MINFLVHPKPFIRNTNKYKLLISARPTARNMLWAPDQNILIIVIVELKK
jgi:hypothetical protein